MSNSKISDDALSRAFSEFSAIIQGLAAEVNDARADMEKKMKRHGTIDTYGNTFAGRGRPIRDYENACEKLKSHIENLNCEGSHNRNLTVEIAGETHAIRSLEVELVHPQVDVNGHSMEKRKNGKVIPEWMITAVRVRGLISIEPADGNEALNYSSKSSSSSVPLPPPA
jgi:hypothetical protein